MMDTDCGGGRVAFSAVFLHDWQSFSEDLLSKARFLQKIITCNKMYACACNLRAELFVWEFTISSLK
jgi:hypothetical protein